MTKITYEIQAFNYFRAPKNTWSIWELFENRQAATKAITRWRQVRYERFRLVRVRTTTTRKVLKV